MCNRQERILLIFSYDRSSLALSCERSGDLIDGANDGNRVTARRHKDWMTMGRRLYTQCGR